MAFLSFFSWTEPLSVVFLFFFGYYLRFKLFDSKYWKNRNVFHLDPVFLLGNNWKVLLGENVGFIFEKRYSEWKEKKLVGFWSFARPSVLVADLDLIKRVLVRDFNHFRDRSIDFNEKLDPLAGHLVNLKGSNWRNLRVKLTPTFTSGKMRMMFPMMVDCGKELEKFLESVADADEEKGIELKEILARFTTDIISSCAFGIETNCISNPEAEFRKYGRKIFRPGFTFVLRFILSSFFPRIRDFFKVRSIPKDVSDFFINVVKKTIEYREKNKVERNDFMQLLIQLKNKGKVDDVDSKDSSLENSDEAQKFTLNQAAAQAFVFFAAGFETSSTTLSFAFYELAVNPRVQLTLQEEIDSILENHGGDITYDAIMEMNYLDWVVQETLRKYPPLTFVARQCTKDYEIPEMGVKLEKGTRVIVSVLGIQKDPEYFPDPETFDPDRFSPEEKAKRDSFTSLPFGEGPRNCIGNRFGLLQTKVGLVSILRRFDVHPDEGTPVPLAFNQRAFILEANVRLYFRLSRRKFT